MTNFNYKQFHTEVEQLTQKANWYRQGGNVAALREIRRNAKVVLPKCESGLYARGSFFSLFKTSFVIYITSTSQSKADRAKAWFDAIMKKYGGCPPIIIEGNYSERHTKKHSRQTFDELSS